MNRADFVAADGQSWWLCETQIDFRTDEARRELGHALGLTENEWFSDPNRRTLLFDLLESHGSPLLNDLDYLTGDDAKLQWVQGAIHLAAPPPTAPAAAPTHDDPTDAAQPTQASTTPAAPPAPAPPPAKKSIFKPKAAADPTNSTRTADEAATDADTTNRNSDAAAGVAAAAPQLDEAVSTVLADVTGDGLAALAQDLGVEADELETIVNHPDFEREVREEVARITVA
jgi:hypothetical protein